MNIASAPPDVRSISLFSLLSPIIQKTIIDTNPDILNDYSSFVPYLYFSFNKTPKKDIQIKKDIYSIKQEIGEPVSVFGGRLLGMIKRLKDTKIDDEERRDIYFSGLLPDIYVLVSQLLTTSTTFEQVQSIAREVELTLAEKREKEEQLTKKTNNNNNNNNSNNNNSNNNRNNNNNNSSNIRHKYCATCGAPTILNRTQCAPCFKGNKNLNNNNNNSNTNINNNNNSNSSNNNNNRNKNSSSSNNFPTATPTIPTSSVSISNQSPSTPDFVNNKVKYLKKDDNNINPLLWSQEKLDKENRCGFCAEPAHPTGKECKFPKYSYAEIRTLKFHNINPPTRKDRPTGDPISP
jgi:hypothetical protein